ncbi:MAG: hypothetical protein ACYSWP_02185 [Planctomycetota bacterium]|jgi:hypothetical protein
MAELSSTERKALWASLMSELSNSRAVLAGLNKNDLRAAVDAIDDGLDSVITTVNSLIPEPAKSGLTSKQKLRLFLAILNARLEVS